MVFCGFLLSSTVCLGVDCAWGTSLALLSRPISCACCRVIVFVGLGTVMLPPCAWRSFNCCGSVFWTTIKCWPCFENVIGFDMVFWPGARIFFITMGFCWTMEMLPLCDVNGLMVGLRVTGRLIWKLANSCPCGETSLIACPEVPPKSFVNVFLTF